MARRNNYILTQLRILFLLLKKNKLSLKKITNLTADFFFYHIRSSKSGPSPYVMNFELWNECGANCIFCRTEKGGIYDQNPDSDGGFVPKGRMDLSVFTDIIDEVKDDLMLAVLYINGEPLLYERINEAVSYATSKKVATLISSNGLLLDEQRMVALLDAGLDFLKIAICGFSQGTYSRQVRHGDVEKVKNNLRAMKNILDVHENKMIVMLDFIRYDYNKHEIDQARTFCEELGFIFNIRPGNLFGTEGYMPPGNRSNLSGCDWPWKAMSVNWDGSLLPCCNYVVWSGQIPYDIYVPGKDMIKRVWAQGAAAAMRKRLLEKGRSSSLICSLCDVDGVHFKY